MSVTARNYGGQSAAERADQRRRQFLEAVLDVSDTLGWRAVTVERLAERAQISKRYFYELFPDVDAAGAAVVDQVVEEVAAAVLATVADDLPFAEFARQSISTLVESLTDDPRRARLLFGELAAGERTSAQRARALRALADTVAEQARAINHQPTLHNSLVETTATFLVGGTGQAILRWLDDPSRATRDELIDDLTTLWVITGDGAARRAIERTVR